MSRIVSSATTAALLLNLRRGVMDTGAKRRSRDGVRENGVGGRGWDWMSCSLSTTLLAFDRI